MKKKLFALSGVFLIVLVITGLWATKAISLTSVEQTVEPATSLAPELSMQQMAESSSFIVIGNCIGTKSEWLDGRRRHLVTLVTISAMETLKGDEKTKTFTVEVPGGADTTGKFRLAMIYPDAPQFHTGENVVLFLNQTGNEGRYAVMAQGKYSIGIDNQGQEFVAPDHIRVRMQRGVGNLQTTPLKEFKSQVLRYLKQ